MIEVHSRGDAFEDDGPHGGGELAFVRDVAVDGFGAFAHGVLEQRGVSGHWSFVNHYQAGLIGKDRIDGPGEDLAELIGYFGVDQDSFRGHADLWHVS